MGETIKTGQLADAISAIFAEYKDAVNIITEESVRDVMNEARADVRDRSPQREKGGKSYKRHWRTSFLHQGNLFRGIVYNDKAGLTHLLEFGHAVWNGGRTEANEHIAPAQATANEAIEKRIKEGIKRI